MNSSGKLMYSMLITVNNNIVYICMSPTLQADSLPFEPPGKPYLFKVLTKGLQTQGLVLFCFPLIQKRESNTHTLEKKKKIKTRERENSKT